MSAAEMVIDANGVIVLVAECRDGIGKYADWLKQAGSPREVIERFECEGFTRDHSSKAFMCARALEHYSVYFYCSGIETGELEQMFFRAVPSPQEAIDRALKEKARPWIEWTLNSQTEEGYFGPVPFEEPPEPEPEKEDDSHIIPPGDDRIHGASIFGGITRKISSKAFKGGSIYTVFGGAFINLRPAQLFEEGGVLDLYATFGGITIRLPKEWPIEIRPTAVLGGVTSRNSNNEKTKGLIYLCSQFRQEPDG
jgi:hypothetical protein